MKNEEERSYIAFISYRHCPLDREAAELIQKKIEHYRIPKDYRKSPDQVRFGNVFRDEDELPASSSLSNSITYALDRSEFLIVICTPDLPLSKWCESEIRYFLQTHDRDHILAVLADGEPETSFSPYLLNDYDEEGKIRAEIEPLAANIKGANHTIDRKKLNKEIVRIYAALLGCPFDALWQRQKRDRTNRLMMIMGAAFLILSGFLGVVIAKNRQINRQNQELERQRSELLVDAGQLLLEEGEIREAIQNARSAIELNDTYDMRAEKLLADSLGAYLYDDMRREKLVERNANIIDCHYDDTHQLLFFSDQFGKAGCVNVTDGELIWEIDSQDDETREFSSNIKPMLFADANDEILFLCNKRNIKAVRAENGVQLWNYNKDQETEFQCVSGDGNRIALMDSYLTNDWTSETYLVILSGTDGNKLYSCLIDEASENGLWTTKTLMSDNVNFLGDFSEDNRYLGIAYVQNRDYSAESRFRFRILDLETETWIVDRTMDFEDNLTYELLGMRVDENGEKLFMTVYDYQEFGIRSLTVTEDEATTTFMKQSFSSNTSMLDYQEDRYHAPLLVSDRLMVTFANDHIYTYDLTTGDKKQQTMVDGAIVGFDWQNRSEEIIWAVTDQGSCYTFDLDDNPDYPLGLMTKQTWGQKDKILEAWKGNRDEIFYREKNSPDQIMILRQIKDSHGRTIIKKDLAGNAKDIELYLSPSGKKLFVIEDGSEMPVRLLSFDTETGELLEKAEFDASLKSIWQMNSAYSETAIVYGMRILNTDGTISYPEKLTEEIFSHSSIDRDSVTVLLSDGHNAVISYTDFHPDGVTDADSPYSKYYIFRCWIDGKRTDGALRITPDRIPSFNLGPNGLFVLYGQEAEDKTTSIVPKGEGEAYIVWNVKDDSVIRMEDPFPVNTKRKIVFAEESPLFAAAESDGTICLFNASDGTSRMLKDNSSGTVRSMCFLPGDEYLAVQPYAGELMILSVEDGSVVFREDISLLDGYGDDLQMKTFRTKNGRFMLIGIQNYNRGPAAVIDPETWTITASIDNVFTYLPAADRVLTLRGGNIVSFPLYAKEDLMNFASPEE